MVDEPHLTLEELACFRELFSPNRITHNAEDAYPEPLVNHVLTVKTDVPQALALDRKSVV